MSQAASQGMQSDGINEPHHADEASVAATALGSNSEINLESVYQPIKSELAQVEGILKSELQSETPFVDQLLEHSFLLGGKRIRPVFVLLSGASVGDVNPAHLQLAAALEMIHTATLLHDDILDEAVVRRHRETANSKWGTKISVLLGDYLFTHAFHVASLGDSAVALRYLAQASNRVCEGEMRQNAWQGDFALSETDYLAMITEKTAELCGVGCKIGALLSKADSDLIDSFEKYGRNLGVAFQIIDDVLDIVGSQNKVGKTLGTDIVNQKPTLPIIHCLENCSSTEKAALIEQLTDSTTTNLDILPTLNLTGSIEYARDVAQQHARLATEFTQTLPPSKYASSLESLAQFVLERSR